MSNIGKSFRQILRFSKLKKITSQPRSYNTTPVIKDLYGKDLYSPKYDKMFFHTPQCFPNLKEEEENYYDKIISEEEKEKHFFDCEDEPWVTNNERED